MNESCSQHGGQMTEHRWMGQLTDTQHKGLFWCADGKHYVEVYKNRAVEAARKAVGK